MRHRYLVVVVALLMALAAFRPALAVVQFYNVFKKDYLDNHPDKKYVEQLTNASVKCLVCHQGKNRKHHNAFGIHLKKVLDRKKDTRDVEKISAEIKKVLAMHVDPKDDKSETFLDRIKASKWPGGELADLKKEPPEDGESK